MKKNYFSAHSKAKLQAYLMIITSIFNKWFSQRRPNQRVRQSCFKTMLKWNFKIPKITCKKMKKSKMRILKYYWAIWSNTHTYPIKNRLKKDCFLFNQYYAIFYWIKKFYLFNHISCHFIYIIDKTSSFIHSRPPSYSRFLFQNFKTL